MRNLLFCVSVLLGTDLMMGTYATGDDAKSTQIQSEIGDKSERTEIAAGQIDKSPYWIEF
jgi:hypothetical protein